MDSGASILVLNYSTYVTIAKLLNLKQNNTLNPSKTLIVANQTEVPILHFYSVTLNTIIEDESRQFTIPFAVADIKYNILGTIFEEYIQNINIQDFTLPFEYQSTVYPYYTKYTSLLSNDYPKITFRIFIETILKNNYAGNLILPRLHTSQTRTTTISILQLHQRINSFLRFHILTSLLNFVQH